MKGAISESARSFSRAVFGKAEKTLLPLWFHNERVTKDHRKSVGESITGTDGNRLVLWNKKHDFLPGFN